LAQTEVVVTLMRLLGPARNGNGAKPAESSKAAEPANDADNPLDDAADAGTDLDVPF
jgi:hypothetical protein